METVVINANGPRLEGVFGPLTPVQDAAFRQGIIDLNKILTDTAERLGGRAGWEGSGLELSWMPSGQIDIGSFISTDDGAGRAVEFSVELRPSWYYGEQTGEPGWDIQIDVNVDCSHTSDHRSMHRVFERTAHASSPEEAVSLLGEAITLLVELATQRSLAEWSALGSD